MSCAIDTVLNNLCVTKNKTLQSEQRFFDTTAKPDTVYTDSVVVACEMITDAMLDARLSQLTRPFTHLEIR
jgi:hypothetical protein